MVGESGIGKSGTKYNYYLCINHKRGNTCGRKAIRQDWLEPFVLAKTQELLMDDGAIQIITDKVWDFYLRQDQQRDKVESLKAQVAEVEKAVNNLMRAIEAGMPLTEITKNRLTELDGQQQALNAAIAQTQLDGGFKLQKDHIQFFFEQFREMDFTDRKCQQRLIDVFVNSIFITDDELTINFNFGGDKSVIKFTDYKALAGEEVFGCRASVSTIKRAYELVFYANVFALIVKMPER